MKLRGRTILVTALLFFGGFAVFDYIQEKKKDEESIQQSRLMTLEFDQVNSIQIEHSTQKFVIQRTVNGWELTEPYKDLADNSVADDFVKNTFTERIIEVANEGNGIDWSRYGLDKPLGKVILTTSSGQKNTFEISEKKNIEENTFARRNQENRVLVINSSWQNKVRKTAMDFRDRRFLRNKISAVDELRLVNEKGAIELKRIDGKWQSIINPNFPIDQNKLRELLTAIANAKASEILPIPAVTSKKLFSLKLKIADANWEAQVDQAKDLGIYAKVTKPQFLMKMEPGALDKLITTTLNDFKEEPTKKPEIGSAGIADKSVTKEKK
jgi:hypothetical protein